MMTLDFKLLINRVEIHSVLLSLQWQCHHLIFNQNFLIFLKGNLKTKQMAFYLNTDIFKNIL